MMGPGLRPRACFVPLRIPPFPLRCMTGSDAEPLAALEIKKIPGGQWRNTDYLASPLGPAEGPASDGAPRDGD